MIGKTLGHYHVAAKLGEGGMGEVYRARDEHLDRDVALKVLPAGTLGDESARRRFRREAEALSPDFKALATNERFVRALGAARAQFDDTVAILEAADARSELPAFMRQPLVDLLRTLAIKQQRASLH